MKITAAIPTSNEVANATNRGEPIVLANPRHPVSQAMRELGRRLLRPRQRAGPAGRREPARPSAADALATA